MKYLTQQLGVLRQCGAKYVTNFMDSFVMKSLNFPRLKGRTGGITCYTEHINQYLSFTLRFLMVLVLSLAFVSVVDADPLSPKEQKKFNREYQMLVSEAEKARKQFLDRVAEIREDFEGDEETDNERGETENYISTVEELNGEFDKLVEKFIEKTEGVE